METVRETDQDGAEESEEQDDSCTVGLLLDMSTECSLSEQDPCDLHDASDWDGAVSNHTLTRSLAPRPPLHVRDPLETFSYTFNCILYPRHMMEHICKCIDALLASVYFLLF